MVAGSAQTFKQLGIQRAFSAYVQNRTDVNRFFRLTLIPDSDVIASFHQFDPSLTRVDVQILAHSSTAVTVYLTRINPDVDLTASARMEVVEIEAAVGGDGQFLDLEGGLATELRFNPDPTIRSSPARS